jgi:hypothetical protein
MAAGEPAERMLAHRLRPGGQVRAFEQKGVSAVVTKSNAKTGKRESTAVPPPVMSMSDLAKLGGGKIAYIKVMTPDQAKAMFPAVEGIPTGINLFALHAADGTPIALTDSRQAAVGHAMGDELEIAAIH